MTSQHRARKHKAKLAEQGLVQVSGWVHRHQAAQVQIMMKMLRANPDLEVGPVRVTSNGRLRSINRG